MLILVYLFLPIVSSNQMNSVLNEVVKCVGLELLHKEYD